MNHQQVNEIFSKLQKDCYFPFREGNGRTQREFIRQLAYRSGYILHFTDISEKEMIEASIDSFICNYKKMEALFVKYMCNVLQIMCK